MAMLRPVLYPVSPFDATKSHIFYFSYSGDQSVKNTIIIKNNTTGKTVYTKTTDSMALNINVPANSLSNGVIYSVQVKVYNSTGRSSELSAPITFSCYSTPVFLITSPIVNSVVENSTILVTLSYSQAENETLNSYQIYLYDSNMNMISQSGVIYMASDDSLAYSFSGLNNFSHYFVKATGATISGFEFQTENIEFSTKFLSNTAYSVVYAENDPITGNITVTSNIISIKGKYDGEPSYIDGTKVDLSNGVPIIYDEGFSADEDFLTQILVEDVESGKNILIIGNNNASVSFVDANIYGENAGKRCAKLTIQGATITGALYSEYFTGDKILVNIKRVNGIYSINAKAV